MKHLVYDNHADIYMYAKLYHNRRPGIWTEAEDYMRLHVALQAACSAPDLRASQLNGTATPVNGTLSVDAIRMPPEGMESTEPNHNIA